MNSRPYRIAFIDIETSPNLGWVWGKWQQNVLEFESAWHLLTFSVKWSDRKKPETYGLPDFPLYKRDHHNDRDLAKQLWQVLDDADLVVAHNGDKFDIRKSNSRFIYHGLKPPSPYKTVDTLKVARKYFGFTSNKLDDIVAYLKIGRKVKTGGFDLWLRCMNGDMTAWRLMKKYNTHDVVLLEQVYNRFRGWHSTHPNITVGLGKPKLCPACGGDNVQRRGWDCMKSYRAQRFHCQDCGKWSRGEREKIRAKILR